MNSHLFTIAKREYLKVIKKPIFWIATGIFPLFLVFVSIVSGYSTKETEKTIAEKTASIDRILVYDEANAISSALMGDQFEKIDSLDNGISEIKAGTADALFYYPESLPQKMEATLWIQSQGVLTNEAFQTVAQELLQSSAIRLIPADQQVFLSTPLSSKTIVFKNGEQITEGIETLILPGIVLIFYILMASFGVSYLLMSVSEEKENRMIEIMLQTTSPKNLIFGKIIGLMGVIFTQVSILSFFGGIFLWKENFIIMGIDLHDMNVTFEMASISIWYLMLGFLFFSSIVMAVGTWTPTYKEAQNFQSVFMVLSFLPLYFITAILASPEGFLAQISSYFPFTAALVLLFRNALGAITPMQLILTSLSLIFWIGVGLHLSYSVFRRGALEYSSPLSIMSWKSKPTGESTE